MIAAVVRNRAVCLTYIAAATVCLSSFATCEIHRTRTSRGAKAYPGAEQQTLVGGGELTVDKSDASFGDDTEIGKRNSDDGQISDEFIYTRDEAWLYAILATVLVGLTGIFPLLLPIDINPKTDDKKGAAKFNCVLSFAVGGLLGDVFLHLLPESWAHIAPDDHYGQTVVGLWVMVGLLVFLSLEKIFGEGGDDEMEKDSVAETKIDEHAKGTTKSVNGGKALLHTSGCAVDKHINQMNGFPPGYSDSEYSVSKRKPLRNGTSSTAPLKNEMNGNGHHLKLANGCEARSKSRGEESEGHREPPVQKKVKVVGYLNLLANFIDNFTHGIAVAGSFLVGRKVGLLTTAAIMLHEVPHEVGDFAILLRSGFTRVQAAKSQMSTALGGLVGAVVTLLSESAKEAGDRSAWILPFTAGGFLHIALVTILPELLQETTSLKESTKQMACLLAGIAVMTAVSVVVG